MPSVCDGVFTHLETWCPREHVVNDPRGCSTSDGDQHFSSRLKIHISIPSISISLQERALMRVLDEWKGLVKAYSETRRLRNGKAKMKLKINARWPCWGLPLALVLTQTRQKCFPWLIVKARLLAFILYEHAMVFSPPLHTGLIMVCSWSQSRRGGRKSYVPQSLSVLHPFPIV